MLVQAKTCLIHARLTNTLIFFNFLKILFPFFSNTQVSVIEKHVHIKLYLSLCIFNYSTIIYGMSNYIFFFKVDLIFPYVIKLRRTNIEYFNQYLGAYQDI